MNAGACVNKMCRLLFTSKVILAIFTVIYRECCVKVAILRLRTFNRYKERQKMVFVFFITLTFYFIW